MNDNNLVSGVFLCLNRCYYNTSSSSPCFLYFWEYLSWFFTFPVSQVLKTILSISHRGTDSNSHATLIHLNSLRSFCLGELLCVFAAVFCRLVACSNSILGVQALSLRLSLCSIISLASPIKLDSVIPPFKIRFLFIIFFKKQSGIFTLFHFAVAHERWHCHLHGNAYFLLSTSVNFHVWANERVRSSGVVGDGWKKYNPD